MTYTSCESVRMLGLLTTRVGFHLRNDDFRSRGRRGKYNEMSVHRPKIHGHNLWMGPCSIGIYLRWWQLYIQSCWSYLLFFCIHSLYRFIPRATVIPAEGNTHLFSLPLSSRHMSLVFLFIHWLGNTGVIRGPSLLSPCYCGRSRLNWHFEVHASIYYCRDWQYWDFLL